MKSLLRLRGFVRKYWLQAALAFAAVVAGTIANLVIPEIIRQVIDVGLQQGHQRTLVLASLAILGIGLLLAGLTYAQRYFSEWLAAHIGYDIRNRLYDHIQHLSFSYHDRTQTGQLISRSIEDVRAIERFFGFGLIELLRLIMLLIGIVILLFLEQPSLAAISLLPMIPLILMTTSFGQRIGKLFLAVDLALGELSSRVQENVTGVQVIRAFAREDYEIERFQVANQDLYDARIMVISRWSRIMPTSHLLVTISTLLILWFGGRMVLNGGMTVGEVVAFNSYLLMLAEPARQLVWLVNLAGEAVAGIQRAYEVLETDRQIETPPGAVKLPPLAGRVSFDQVCFRYREGNAPALQNIDLEVEPNQVIALIGPTGSGKTSLINLIPRFYDVNEGAVRVDGIDVRTVDLPSLRRQIGIVLQNSLLFSSSIRENIAYGRPDASLDEVKAAARAAQAHEFIAALPEEYDTIVGERGITLSGGQRQRVAIARALLMDPRILILDDSTSSVDTETERLIQRALGRLMEGRTTFIIAHRLSTVRRADLILVMDQGRIVERGQHLELLEQGGLYREIYDLQLRDQEQFQEEMAILDRRDGPVRLNVRSREERDRFGTEAD